MDTWLHDDVERLDDASESRRWARALHDGELHERWAALAGLIALALLVLAVLLIAR